MKKFLIIVALIATFWATPSFAETNTVTSTVTGTTTVDKTPPTASAPNVMINNQDVCSTGTSAAVQTQVLGIAGGTTIRDLNCERLKLSRALYGMGMKVAAVSLLCQDARVFEAMEQAGTPCPFEGKIGADAKAQWNKYDIERPDYDKYVEKMDDRLKIDERIMKEEGILEENESLKTDINAVAKENKKLEKQIKKLEKIQLDLVKEADKKSQTTGVKLDEVVVEELPPQNVHEGFEEKKSKD